jgi:hypothetical protein
MMTGKSVLTPAELLYEEDFIAWTELMATLPENRDVADLDWNHLAEEIRDLGNSQKSALESHLENVQLYLIKWEIQPERRSGSWETSISKSRRKLETLCRKAPSLRAHMRENFECCYETAYRYALVETHLPTGTPYTRWPVEKVLYPGFLPE